MSPAFSSSWIQAIHTASLRGSTLTPYLNSVRAASRSPRRSSIRPHACSPPALGQRTSADGPDLEDDGGVPGAGRSPDAALEEIPRPFVVPQPRLEDAPRLPGVQVSRVDVDALRHAAPIFPPLRLPDAHLLKAHPRLFEVPALRFQASQGLQQGRVCRILRVSPASRQSVSTAERVEAAADRRKSFRASSRRPSFCSMHPQERYTYRPFGPSWPPQSASRGTANGPLP